MTRTPHTEAERAEQALGVAQRKVEKTEGKLEAARKLVKDLEAELEPLKARRDFLANDPALPQEEPDDELLAPDNDPPLDSMPDEPDADLDDLPLDERIRNGV